MVRHSAISPAQAYTVLGLNPGSSLENVKSTYKQLALKTHPDKNPDNEDATEQFQKLSEAYNVLLKHLDTSSPQTRPPFGGYEYDEEDFEDGDYDSDYEDQMAFYMFLFEELLRGRASRYSSNRYHRQAHPSYSHPSFRPPEESEDVRQARLRKMRQSQEEAEARRERDAANRKAREQKEREREMKAAAERREQKAWIKKAKAEADRQSAAKSARSQKERMQCLRSAVFTAARNGETSKVKKGIWEDEVDAAGGEVMNGCEDFVQEKPQDPSETLMHIVAKQGDKDLLEWLGSHGADPEERDGDRLTAFHISLKHGHRSTIKYFFDAYPPEEAETKPIYTVSSPNSLLQLAVDSHEPEVVWTILERKLAGQQEITDAWTCILSSAGKDSFLNEKGSKTANEKKEGYEDVIAMIKNSGGFTPPPTPKVSSPTSIPSPKPASAQKGPSKISNSPKPHQHRRQNTQSSIKDQGPEHFQSDPHPKRGRGRGRGGRGRTRDALPP